MLLPHGIVTVSLTTALYTRMSGAAARNDLAETHRLSALATKPVAYISIAASACFVALGPLITTVLFGSPIIGQVLQVLTVGLIGFSQAYVLNRTSFALQDARGPLVTQLVIASVTALGSAAAALLLPPHLTVIGVAGAITVANFAGWVTAHLALRRVFAQRGHPPALGPTAILHYARLVLAGSVGVGAGLVVVNWIGTPTGDIGKIVLLAGAGLAVAVTFAGLSWLCGDRTWSALRRR
jgi:putative peptidoglycan lipid II flippase